MTRTRVAILGSMFDPIHIAHTAVLEQVIDAIGAEQGWLIPARRHALRGAAPLASDPERLELVRAAALTHPRLRVDDLELRLPEPTRTLVTLRALVAAHPAVDLWWVLGADQARQLQRWHRPRALLREASFVLVNRSGHAPIGPAEARTLGFDPGRTQVVEVESPPISSSAIRARLLAGEPAAALADPVRGPLAIAVAERIAERGLYRPSATLESWNPPPSPS